jgi:hypothetical protein
LLSEALLPGEGGAGASTAFRGIGAEVDPPAAAGLGASGESK